MSKRIERGCRKLGVRTVFKSGHTLRDSLIKVKNLRPGELKRDAVYEVPVGTVAKCVHACATMPFFMSQLFTLYLCSFIFSCRFHPISPMQHSIESTGHQHMQKRKVLEAIHIKREPDPSNLDCGLQLNMVTISHAGQVIHPIHTDSTLISCNIGIHTPTFQSSLYSHSQLCTKMCTIYMTSPYSKFY